MPASDKEPQWHVLDFFSDDEGSCALTIFINGVRFHVIADATKLDENTDAGAEYHGLVQDLQRSTEKATASQPSTNDNTSSDSGVDVKHTKQDENKENETRCPDYDVEETIKSWMVDVLADSFEELTPPLDASQPRTLQDWYHSTTKFFELLLTDDGKEIQAVELESSSEMQERMKNILPQTTLPKYISDNLEAPLHNASDLIVLECSDQPPGTPYHPCRVQNRETKDVYFFKIVDNIQPQATKREIDILLRIHAAGLHKKFHVPSVEGVVTFDEAGSTSTGKERFMGFLQNEIPSPTPLTTKLGSDVSQKKRESWAKEVNRIKDLLHEHNIIWGDAKADNFMVDAEDRLWIIDFGGGYTEGWVDREFNETVEGDDIGTEKIVNALKDPEKNVCDPDEDEDEDEDEEQSSGGVQDTSVANNKKRKRKEAASEEETREAKAQKAL